MKLNDNIKMTGRLSIRLYDKFGNLKDSRNIDNLVVTAGKTFVAARMVGVPTAMSHMALGSGVGAPAAGDTTLGTELGRAALSSGTSAGSVATYAASFAAGVGTGAVTEAGIFNAAAAGTMLSRTTFAVVNKGASDSMTVSWAVTVG
jgi:threonine dehydratase